MSHHKPPANVTTLPTDLPPNVAAVFKGMPPSSAALGLEIIGLDADAGVIDVAYNTTDTLLNKWGAIHGGMVAAMMDDVMALAAGLKVEWGQIVPTLEMKVNYIAPARPGRLTARAQVVRRGKSVIFVDADLWGPDGALLATGSSTYTLVTLKKKDK